MQCVEQNFCSRYFNHFIFAVNEEPHGRVCSDGLWFNLNQQRCTPAYQTTCELDPIVCLGVENEETVRAPASCSDFVSCINGRPFPGEFH
jgi:hypothetical protein